MMEISNERELRTVAQKMLALFEDVNGRPAYSGELEDMKQCLASSPEGQQLEREFDRVLTSRIRRMSNAELIWELIWGPSSSADIDRDDGKRTPAPSSHREQLKFHHDNLIDPRRPEIPVGDLAAAIRYFRQHTDGSSPEAMLKSLRKLGRRFDLRVVNAEDR
jgi:hypothetical protein